MKAIGSNEPRLRFKDEQGRDYPDCEKKTLGEITNILGGGTPRTNNREYWDGDINWFTPSEINSKYCDASKQKITKAGLSSSSARLLPAGTVLFTTRATIGLTSISLCESTTNQGIHGFVVRNDVILNEYLYYWLLINTRIFVKLGNGSTYLEVRKPSISKIDIVLPSVDEQRKITDFLSAVDEKIEQLERKRELLELYKKGLMQKLFSQELRFKDNQGREYPDWVEKQIREMCFVNKGKQVVQSEIVAEGYPVIAGGKTSPYCYPKHSHQNAITVSSSGAYAGFVAYHSYKFWGSDCSVISAADQNEVTTLFIYYLFIYHQQKIYSLQIGGAQPHVYPRDIKTLRFPTPKSVHEQQQIANFLSTVDEKIQQVNSQIERTQLFKQGLLQQLFV